MREDFQTTTRRQDGGSALDSLARYRPQIAVSVLVVLALAGAAIYASRFSEREPRVVYSFSLEEVASEARQPLVVNINTADAEELDELPQVGPDTAEKIIDYRRSNGFFKSVSDLEKVSGIGPATLEEIRPFATI